MKDILQALYELILKVCKLPKSLEEMEHLSSELKFTREEVMQMPKDFRQMFRKLGCVVHVLKYFEDNEAYFYELRFYRNGYNVVTLSRDLAEAKKFFIAEVNKL